jgi:hypothetical protein
MKKSIITSLLIVLGLILFPSCKKETGYGGNSAIKGVLKIQNYNFNYTTLKSESVLADEYVYIIFEDGKGYGDRVKTSYDGSFSFTRLKSGKYKIYAYSKDISSASLEDVIVLKEVEITKNKQLVDAGDIVTATNVTKPGNSIVQGKIIATSNTGTFFATNQKIFIAYEGNSTYSRFVYTDEDGEYQFLDVPTGNHRIYVFSKNTEPNPTSPTVVVEQFANVSSTNQVIQLPDFNINK